MVDDDDVRFGGALPHPRYEAVVIPQAVGAEAGVRRRGNLVPEPDVFRQILQFRAIAGIRATRPFADDRQEDVVRGQPDAFIQLIEPVQAR